MRLLDYPEVEVDLTANAAHCFEHDDVQFLPAGEEFDEGTLCPFDEGHAVMPLLVTDTVPDGVPADVALDYFHYGEGCYHFALEPDE